MIAECNVCGTYTTVEEYPGPGPVEGNNPQALCRFCAIGHAANAVNYPKSYSEDVRTILITMSKVANEIVAQIKKELA